MKELKSIWKVGTKEITNRIINKKIMFYFHMLFVIVVIVYNVFMIWVMIYV